MFVRFDFEKREWVNEVTCVDSNDVKTVKDTLKIKILEKLNPKVGEGKSSQIYRKCRF